MDADTNEIAPENIRDDARMELFRLMNSVSPGNGEIRVEAMSQAHLLFLEMSS